MTVIAYTTQNYEPPCLTRKQRAAASQSQTSSVYYENLRRDEAGREERFLAAIRENLSSPMAGRVTLTWDRIKGVIPGVLRVPQVNVKGDSGALLSWDQGIYHLDVEILEDGSVEFFYLNRETDEAWNFDGNLNDRFPENVLQHFNRFVVVP